MNKEIEIIESLKAKHAQSGRMIVQLESIFMVHQYLEEQGIEFGKNSNIGVHCVKFDKFNIDKSVFNIRINGEIISLIPFDRVPLIYVPEVIKQDFIEAKNRKEKHMERAKRPKTPDCFNLQKERENK